MITVKTIIEKIHFSKIIGDTSIVINQIIPLDIENPKRDVLMWVSSKNIAKLPLIKNGVVICPNTEEVVFNQTCTYLQSENPRNAFFQTLKILYPNTLTPIIATSAKIASDVVMGGKYFYR
jgi:UDP-3-O-[3-hydroxymyristoyl] glucosamine N-acyltransferase